MSEDVYPPQNPVVTGLLCRCPRCGKGPLLKGYLTIAEKCTACDLDLTFADTADGPAFFVMSIVGTLGMIGFMIFEFTQKPPFWLHLVLTFPLIIAACVWMLRPAKGVMVAMQYRHKAKEARF